MNFNARASHVSLGDAFDQIAAKVRHPFSRHPCKLKKRKSIKWVKLRIHESRKVRHPSPPSIDPNPLGANPQTPVSNAE
jgi:hypothetical protein